MTNIPEMADQSPEMREGIFLPNIEKLSKEWRAVITAESAAWRQESAVWQAKLDSLTALMEELRDEVRRLRGLTVTIDRGDQNVP